jgi:hypothetical protein
MSEKLFKFSEAALLYASNMDIVREMREAAISNVSHFFKKLLLKLPDSLGDLGTQRLCKNITHSGKGYEGCDFIHLWVGQDEKKDWAENVGYIMYAVPIVNRVINEWSIHSAFGVFEPVKSNRIKIWVGYRGDGTSIVRGRILSLARNSDLGEYVKDDNDSFVFNINLEAEDPLGSASTKLATLLKAIKSVQE